MHLAIFHNLPSGGALRALYEKIRLFKQEGHQISVYTFSTSEQNLFDFSNMVDRYEVEPLHFEGKGAFKNYVKATTALAMRINGSDADWVWVDKCRFFGSPSILRFLKKPLIFYTHEPLRIFEHEQLAEEREQCRRTHFSWFKKLNRILRIIGRPRAIYHHFLIKNEDRRNILAAKNIAANSFFTQRWLKRVYGVEAKVVYQGVDVDFFCPSSGALPKEHLLSVGRIHVTKGHDFLIRAISCIPKNIRPKLLIVSDTAEPTLLDHLSKLSSELDVAVEFRCQISDEELREAYWKSHLVLCASVNEPFGLVPLEAMACGVPVLAVKEGGFVETVLDNQTGFLLERNKELWAKKIQDCLARPDEMVEFGQRGRQHVLSFWTWKPFVGRVTDNLRLLSHG